jgi:DNA-binding phage protein
MKFPMTNLAGICTAAALVLMLGSNLVDIGRVHDALLKTRGQQQVNLGVSKRAETQLDALAKGTKALADAGNPNARAILGVLKQNGIQVNAEAAPAAP